MDNNARSNVRICCRDLMRRIRALDFSIYEITLYLDAYPDCAEALEYYHRLCEQRDAAVAEYESKCGPLTMHGNKSRSTWQWIRGPWPWEYDAN